MPSFCNCSSSGSESYVLSPIIISGRSSVNRSKTVRSISRTSCGEAIFFINGERKTKVVCELHIFAPLGLTNFKVPFLADANVQRMEVYNKSSLPRLCRSSAKVSNTFFSVPSLTQLWKRRWQEQVVAEIFQADQPTASPNAESTTC